MTSWSASPQVATPGTLAATGFDDQTVRNIVFTSAGGDSVRLVLTNVFGTTPLRVGHVTVAVAGSGAAVVPGTIHQVTFGGGASLQIPPGAQVLSDPVPMRVQALQDLAVSVYLPGQTGAATFHSDAQQVNWVSGTGDHAVDAGAGAFTTQTQEAKREAVNAWIRTSGAFDGVIDFDQLMRDPADPLTMNPAYDSGDHLHPNDAGYQVMASAISLRMLFGH